jgi:ferric iron reductase protein FhuF
MHDPALWASWYLWLLVVPALVIGTLIRDWFQRRQPARSRRRK